MFSRHRSTGLAFTFACLALLGVARAQCPAPLVSAFPWSETFDSFGATPFSTVPPVGWTQSTTDNAGGFGGDWFFCNGATPTPGTGPDADHSTGVAGLGFYAYVEDSGLSQASVVLESPCLDLGALASPVLRFWYHSVNAAGIAGPNSNSLRVDLMRYPAMGAPVLVTGIFSVGAVGAGWHEAVVDLSPFAPDVVQVIFAGRSDGGSFTHDIAIDDVSVQAATAFDVGIDSIVGPAGAFTCGTTLSSSEVVTIRIANLGSSVIAAGTMVPVEYSVDGSPVAAESAVVPVAGLAPGETFDHVFLVTVDLAQTGSRLIGARTLAADAVPGNDATERRVVCGSPSIVASFPWTEDFELLPERVDDTTIPPPCWEQDPFDDGGVAHHGDWFFRRTQGDNPGTGPLADHSTGLPGLGFFAYVDDSGTFGTVNLSTPLFDLSALVNPVLEFWMHSLNGGSPGFESHLSVDVFDAMGVELAADVLPPQGPSGPDWVRRIVDLGAFSGQTVRLRFQVVSTLGSFLNDVAIDDLSLHDTVVEGGFPPQPGAAVMDVGAARNLAGFGVESGKSGIYYADLVPNESTAFHFEGEPGQPIILLSGPKHIANQIYTLIGNQQLDIGDPGPTPFDPPTNIGLVVSGLDPGFLSSLFVIGASGTTDIAFVVPPALSGTSIVMQAILFNSVTIVRFSNALQFDVQ